MLRTFFITSVCLPLAIFGQVREQGLEEVTVIDLLLREKPHISYKMTREELLKKQPEDLGDLLKSFPGITLKNYGGLGGLKTISARGINGTHTGILVDGFLVQHVQTGQVDLGTVQVENSTEVKFSYGAGEEKLQPVSAYFNASNLFIQTFENQFSTDTIQLRFGSKLGSYGQSDNYLSGKWNHKRFYLAAFGRYRQAEGNFPFTIQNLSENVRAERLNNDLREFYGGLSFGKLFANESRLKINLVHNFSDKGLPGAVILYNPSGSQRLTNSNLTANLDYRFRLKTQLGRTYFSCRYDELIYLDSSYLNMQGFLKSVYFNTNALGGLILKKQWKNKSLVYGLEEQYAYLQSNAFADPVQRFHSKMILELSLESSFWLLELSSGLQQAHTVQGVKTVDRLSYNPGIALYNKRPLPLLYMGQFGLRRTMRMPSFNELFYNQIGNVDLKPEIANQSNLGSKYKFNIHKNYFKITYNIFVNYIENKIVAIPTKNLFVWSIQNVGKVWIYGLDLTLLHERKIGEKLTLTSSGNYTFQRVMDYSDVLSLTFRHQVAYMPLHLFNGSFSADYGNYGINFSLHATSLRYALNENIPANEVPGFYLLDVSLYASRQWKEHEFRLSFNVKNVSGSTYEYIRNYVMPGRNYLISLNYALH